MCVCVYHIFFIHSSIDRHLGSFHNLAIVDNAAINIGGCMCHFELVFLYPLDKYLVVQLLGRKVVLFLIFWGTTTLFSRLAAPVCIPPSSAKRSSFSTSSPTSVVAWVVHVSYSDRCEVVYLEDFEDFFLNYLFLIFLFLKLFIIIFLYFTFKLVSM